MARIAVPLVCTWLAFSAASGRDMAGSVDAHAPGGQPPSSSQSRRASVSLIADTNTPEPGKPFLLGIHFELSGNWHIYWNGMNDSGRAPTIKLQLPAGWKHAQVQWPVPKRHVVADIVLDHVYEKQVTLLVEVTPGPDRITDPAVIKADLTYMICDEMCEIERAQASLTLDPHAPSRADGSKDTISAAQARLPRPLSQAARDGFTIERLVQASADGSGVEKAGFKIAGAAEVELYPALETPTIQGLLRSGSVKGDAVIVEFETPIEDPRLKANPLLGGVLSIVPNGGKPRVYYSID
ncbi:MAG TPA: protein-disulfide reductase DsbD domain-containing protein [Phycisphaerales bacterium]|nr:protein-disulfide reductase DsbD domain-containing protein [Phycisphaerales bacterium]